MHPKDYNNSKLGRRVNEFAEHVKSATPCYKLIQEGKIKSVKIGGARIITTQPEEFLRQAAESGEL